MSIEKVNFQKVVKEQIPYTLVYTKVVQKIEDPFALAVWVYLLSLPHEWHINKSHIKKHFNIGNARLKRTMSFLCKSNLIEYVQMHNVQGTFAHCALNVLCGDRFVNIQQHTKCANVQMHIMQNTFAQSDLNIDKNINIQEDKSCATAQIHDVQMCKSEGTKDDLNIDKNINIQEDKSCATGGSKTAGSVNRSSGKRPPYKRNKKIIKKIKSTKEISCASNSDARESFERFWNIFPRKRNKLRAFEAWVEHNCHSMAQMIIDKVSFQVLHDAQWKVFQFITYPETYIRNARWEDEIEIETKKGLGVTGAIEFALNAFKNNLN